MKGVEQRAAAARFGADWQGRGDEKQETQLFWISLLQDVFGVEEPTKYIQFELPVKLDHTSFIDGYIPTTRVLIEQKGKDIDLRKGYKQSDGSMLTPFGQARRYGGFLPYNQTPRWIVACNFREFHIHDMNRPNDEPEVLLLEDFEKEYHRLNFLVDTGSEHIKKEMEISLQAGELVGVLYEALLKQYKEPDSPETLKSLNKLCVRLVFCLYAEDAGIFGGRNMFHDYLRDISANGMRRALVELFRVLDQRPEDRDKYLADDNPALAAFPYVNGGLFSDENIEIPPFTDELKTMLLHRASEDFDWSEISPTIFGAVFESTLNPETRRSGGMHYTSIENIHKVIDPLFLDGLKAEFEEIKGIAVDRTRKVKLEAFQKKLARLKFLDPACGSGNFLTETYISLRRLENKAISLLHRGQVMLNVGNPIQVSIGQFYGIEINDFAVTVAKTALWIAESQMMKETEGVVHMSLDFLPLKSYANITEGNALQVDWESVVPKRELNYIMGNPPFVGFKFASESQKQDMKSVFTEIKPALLDYVCCWYRKAAEYIMETKCEVAFVSTNSISQGQMAGDLWTLLLNKYSVHINFAWKSFIWKSESSETAKVHVVIIGFAYIQRVHKILFSSNNARVVSNICPYLFEGDNVLITSRKTPICDVPLMVMGNQAMDGGNLIIENDEYEDFLKKEPSAAPFIKRYMMGYEFINNKKRWCLWLVKCSPSQLKSMPYVMKRVKAVQEMRALSKDAGARKKAETPMLFREQRNPAKFVAIPIVSSERRKYIPLGYLDDSIIAGNKLFIIPDAELFHFGILTSNVHMAWMRTVAARLKSDYTYSKDVVYNNFPWPTPTDKQKAKIEQTAKGILDARALYPDSSLADLYDETTMPPELRKAHQNNDRAVMEAYGFSVRDMTESSCVAELMKMYQELTEQKGR
ncbi:DNA methyltransferase [Acutalibacter intestini]|uniref:DNA methyltransferase n=1 Tax=Acutalibacter intestini TaxID=3093659 RepID=UPI002AC9C545|nr:DNA methyltransferase [Acutalibacter sp. M00204]